MSDDDRDDDDEAEELQVLVVDAGSAEWRAGFATDDGPSALFAPSGTAGLLSEQNWRTVFTELEVEAEGHAILLSERPGTPPKLREQLAQLLFDKFRVRALLFVPSTLLTLYAMDCVTGVVVDIGEDATVIQCIYEGTDLLGSAMLNEFGGGLLTNWLADMMAKPAVTGTTQTHPSPRPVGLIPPVAAVCQERLPPNRSIGSGACGAMCKREARLHRARLRG